jgi:hypothetical protein
MTWQQATLIVAAQDADLARALAAGIAPDTDTDGMWRTPLSATGQEPATHFVSAGLIQDAFAAIVGDVQATYDAAGGQVPLQVIEGLYARATISDGEGLQVIAQAGLQFVEPA